MRIFTQNQPGMHTILQGHDLVYERIENIFDRNTNKGLLFYSMNLEEDESYRNGDIANFLKPKKYNDVISHVTFRSLPDILLCRKQLLLCGTVNSHLTEFSVAHVQIQNQIRSSLCKR